MLIGMVLSSDDKTIVPFIEGQTVRVFNTDSHQIKDAPNPALKLKEGKRGAVVNWFYEHGVELICSPPGTLCDLSYKNAQEKKMNFYRLNPGTTFSEFQTQLENGQISLEKSLPANEVNPSN